MLRTTTWVSLVILFGYLTIAHSVRNLYPFSTFDMYATSQLSVGSRVIAIDPQGQAHEIRRFSKFVCEEPLAFNSPSCPNRQIAYLTEEFRLHIEANQTTAAGPGAVPLQIVQRVWTFRDEGLLSVEDCPVFTCTAEPIR